jgi:CHAT domain-containing protein
MNEEEEEEQDAYLDLVFEIVNCSNGEEKNLLAARPEMLNEQLVAALLAVADMLNQKEEENTKVSILTDLAEKLAEQLGIDLDTDDVEAQFQFFIKILYLIEESDGNPVKVYELFKNNLNLLNFGMIEVVKAWANVQFAEIDLLESQKLIAGLIGELGNLTLEFPLGNRAANTELSIICYESALKVFTKADSPIDWSMVHNNLAGAYNYRILGDKAENIEASIFHHKSVLEVISKDSSLERWVMSQLNLGTAYKNRIRGNRAENLEKSITYYKSVLELHIKDDLPIYWAMTHNNLANAYIDRIKGNRIENLEMSIACCKSALEVHKKDTLPIDWTITQNNLANAYSQRIRGDKAGNLEKSIACHLSILEVRKKDVVPEDWAITQSNLAAVYRDRIKGKRAENIENSIKHCKSALEVYKKEDFPIDWAKTQLNLALSYSSRIEEDRAENIELSIVHYKFASEAYVEENLPIDWATTQNNLASAYSNRIEGDRAENIELSIACYESALQVRKQEDLPIDWAATQNNLASAYYDRIKGNRNDNLKNSIKFCEFALEIYTKDEFPRECRRTSRFLANLHAELENWDQAAEAYENAFVAAETLYQSCDFLYSKAEELKETADLPRLSAYAYAKVGDLQSAVVAIEIGRARGLSESLERDRADLQQLAQLAPELAAQYQEITQGIREIETQQRQPQTPEQLQGVTPDEQRNIATNLRKNLQKTIEQIRQQPEYEDFLRPPSIEDIFVASQPHQPIVYLIPSPNGSLALIVTPQEILPVWIDNFNTTNLENLTELWFDAYSGNNYSDSAWQQEIDYGTQILWQVMEPITNCLKTHNFQQAILVPTGLFSLFPLHAAWKEDLTTISKRHYALDSICFSYVPNARSISECRLIAERVTLDTLLAIDEPTHQGANPLPNSSREVTSAISTFPNSIVLRHQEATRQKTLATLSKTTVWHCSCHGNAKAQTPLDSGLYMSGEGAESLLTLRDLLTLQLTSQGTGGIRLTVLSACETGLPGISNIDEVVSLPSGLLQAGVAGVIASLWSVGELSTMILLSRFYTLWRTEGLEPPIALRTSQQWLRDAESDEIIRHCSTFIPNLDQQKELRRALKLIKYSSPYHWAAFSYTGI